MADSLGAIMELNLNVVKSKFFIIAYCPGWKGHWMCSNRIIFRRNDGMQSNQGNEKTTKYAVMESSFDETMAYNDQTPFDICDLENVLLRT